MLENIGGGEILVILLIILIFWGPAKLPEMGKHIGKGIFEFRRAMREVQDNLDIPNEIRDIRSNLDISKKIEDLKSNIANELTKESDIKNEITKENNPQTKQDS
jgi:sec-independent protein translocase protein TatA